MARQYKVVYDGNVVGRFTIKCARGENGGWQAVAKYRNQFTAWSLDKTVEFVHKHDAINDAYLKMVAQSEIDKFELVPEAKTQWALV